MKKYIGFKMVEATPMTKEEFHQFGTSEGPIEYITEGYKVVYPDGYVSWSPKEVFEKAYMQVGNNNTITQENVEKFVKEFEITKLGEKTTVVKATLVNDFVIVESSSCVDPNNFDMQIGIDICKNRIENKIWELLGFLLQTAKEGIK